MKLNTLFLAALLAAPIMLLGQKSYDEKYKRGMQEGYVILNDGSKVNCTLKIAGRAANHKVIQVIEGSSIKPYEATDIKAYGFGNILFESKSFENLTGQKTAFFQLLEDGCLSIYKRTFWTIGVTPTTFGPAFMIAPQKTTIYVKEYKGGELTYIAIDSFRNEWTKMLKDNPAISKKIANREKGYRLKNYITIAREYNQSCN